MIARLPAALRRPGTGADAAALVAGLALALAFAPFALWPLAVAAPAVLFVTWSGCTPRRAAWRGWLFGIGQFGLGAAWVRESFQFAQIAVWLSALLTVGFVALLAAYPALLGALVARLGLRRPDLAPLVLMPGGWVLFEWLRGFAFTGFAWLQLGQASIDTPFAGFLPLGGVYAPSLVLALGAGALAWSWRRGWRRAAMTAAAIGLAALAGLALGTVRWTEPAGEPLRATLIQGNVPQDQKWRPEMRRPTLERYLTLTRASWGSDLVIWPETALPGLRSRLAPFIDRLDAEARERGSRVLFGVPSTADGQYLNSVLLIGADAGTYHKRHLVPFGEYLPLAGILQPVVNLLGVRVADFSPGPHDQPPLVVGPHRIGVTVCYEVAFGHEVRRALPAAAFLVTVSNDAWFGTSVGPHQHFQIARLRALETGRYLLRATNTGISAAIGPRGEVLARSPQFELDALDVTVEPRRGATPYVHAGDWPAVALAVALFVLGALRRRAG